MDPNAPARPDSGLFGLDSSFDEALVRVLPVPFDATTSYRPGAAAGPEAVLRASHQVDLFDRLFGAPWRVGIALADPDPEVLLLQREVFPRARRVIAAAGDVAGDASLRDDLAAVNAAGARLNAIVQRDTEAALEAGKLPIVLGGDHSVPFGGIAAAATRHPGLGVLHFDAHADLRRAYEGFEWSHASILDNVVERIAGVERVLQVGVRDLCDEEALRIAASDGRVRVLYDDEWAREKLSGADLRALVRQQLALLPATVWITFDVDGLDPQLCPNTGTPVPGGLSWQEAMLWLEELATSGKRVVGADLVEVAPPGGRLPGAEEHDSWDAIVGARLLYRLVGCALANRPRA